jgi:hypothetical protein
MKLFKSLFVSLFAIVCVNSYAADSYDASSNTLTIPLVNVNNTYYSNVKINVGVVVSIGSKSSSAPTYDTYNAASNQLTIPEVVVGSSTYYNVVITVGPILSVGASCATAAACTPSTTSANSIYATPATYATAIQTSYAAGTLTSASALTARSRYLISDSAAQSTSANYLQIGDTYSATSGYAVEAGSITSSATYETYLRKLIQVVADSSGYYRLDPHLHPNNSIDFDSTDDNKLKFRNNFGKAANLYGYVTFAYDSSTKLLQAKKRYKYSYTSTSGSTGTSYAVSYTEDNAFTAAGYYVNLSGGVYKLVSAASSATPFYLYNSPLDLGVPEFLNPNKVAFVTNGPAPFLSKNTVAATEGTSGSIYRQVNATYRPQVLNPGTDTTTKTNADAMLASIKTTVEAAGEKLRYAPALYTAFRDATLAYKLVSDSISDGTPGQNLVPYVYFTNEKDTSGKYHPMMVVVNYGNQPSPNGLKDVPHPPALGSGSYAAALVTRFSNLENYVTTIPMKDYGVVTDVTENVYTKNLWIDRTTASLKADVYTYADSADNGLLIDGSVMFPAYNNTLVPSHLFGELTASGCHVGQGGGGPHCHFDGYQSGLSLGVYADADYVGKTHPPLIGFGYDGIALFGKYRSSDTSMLGYSTALDSFGAHNHDSIGYHYHAHLVTNHKPELISTTSTLNVLMKGAYIGKTNSVPFFRASGSFSTNQYMGGTVR